VVCGHQVDVRPIAFVRSPFTLDADGISADTSGLEVAWLRDPDGSILTIFTAPE
jgi:hypothetical protein